MVKAWDLTDLVKRLEVTGLILVEKEARDATKAILAWTQESLSIEGGMIAAVAVPAIALVGPMIDKLEDKIDGVEGN